MFSNTVFAKTTYESNPTNTKLELSDSDSLKIKENIKTILDTQYEIMKTWKFKSNQELIGDSKLLELIEKTNKFKTQWYKKVNLKALNYNSTLDIENIQKNSNNKYTLNVKYSIDFYLSNSNVKSSSFDEKYIFELEKKGNNYYITKMLDLTDMQEEPINSTNQVRSINKLDYDASKKIENTEEYDNFITDKISSIDDISNNIDRYAEEQNKQTTSVPVNTRAAYSGYKANAAVNYALKWAYSFNPKYHNYDKEGGDCTNFVSQCVNWGGIPTAGSAWSSNTTSWINVKAFYNYMRSSGYTSGGDSSSGSRLGDVIQLYHKKWVGSDWSHTVIITGRDGSGWLYSAHSDPRKNYPIANVYPTSSYTNIRYIKFWH